MTLCIVATTMIERSAESFPKYSDFGGGPSCAGCHGAFTDAMSPKGSIFPFDNKHLMHRASSAMNTDCALCHHTGDENNPDMDFSDSDGFGGGPGFGCLGCHGRDYGPGLGVMGVGLREHHRTVGIASCGATSCHQDDPAPLPENIPPPYYGSFDTRAWDACNAAPTYGEDFTLDDMLLGLDNDGDGLYDEDDPDCLIIDCPADLTGDGDVGFGDILAVIGAWGPCMGCDEDLDENDDVGFSDILIVIGSWGPCP